MRIPLLVGVLLLVGAPSLSAQQLTEKQRTAIADTVKDLVKKLYDAENQRNADVFIGEATDDPDFRYISTGNLFPSKDSLSRSAHARVKALKSLTYTLKQSEVTVLAPDAAVFTGAYDETAVDSTGKSLTYRDGFTAVYQRRHGQWKIVHGHFSRGPAPAGAGR